MKEGRTREGAREKEGRMMEVEKEERRALRGQRERESSRILDVVFHSVSGEA